MSTQRDDLQEIFSRYCDWQAHNNRGSQIGIYSIAFIGLTVALRRVRPFRKFTKPSDIPDSFIKNRREVSGFVNNISPNGNLMLRHSPIIKIPGINTNKENLPVKIANVNVSSLGVNWLQSIVAGNEVTVVPLSKKNSNYLLCEVSLTQKLNKNKEQTIDLGESLMSIGFGKFNEEPMKVNDIMHKIYIDRLKYAEERFLKREMGIRYYVEPTKALILSTLRFIAKYSILQVYQLITKRLARIQQQKKAKQLTVGT